MCLRHLKNLTKSDLILSLSPTLKPDVLEVLKVHRSSGTQNRAESKMKVVIKGKKKTETVIN